MANAVEQTAIRHRESRLEDGKPTLLEKPSLVDEKQPDSVEVLSVDSEDADEALELVGSRRTQQFSEEYNEKLRKKLVSVCFKRPFEWT